MTYVTDPRWLWIAEIRVPLENGAFWVSTGYPIAPNLVITARHALNPTSRTTHGTAEVRLHNQKGEGRTWRRIIAPKWSPESDIVIVEVEDLSVPPTFQCLVSYGIPRGRASWESMGFARVGTTTDGREPTGLFGNVNPSSGLLSLGVQYAVQNAEDYSGISGAPVFVDGRIVGVIVTCPSGFNASRVMATPVGPFLSDSDFRDAAGIPRVELQDEVVQRSYFALVGEAKLAVQELLAELGWKGTEKWNQETAAKVVEQLLALRLPDLIEFLTQLHVRLSRIEGTLEDLRGLENLVYTIAPYALTDSCRKLSEDADVIEEIFATRAIGEIHMAGADGRVILFRQVAIRDEMLDPRLPFSPAGKPLPDPTGELELSLPAEPGMEIGSFIERIHDDFANLFLSKPPSDRQASIALVRDHLDDLARLYKYHYYVLFDSEVGHDFAEVSRQLNEAYPSLKILSLSNDHEMARQERRIINFLNGMTYRIRVKERFG